MRRAHVIVTGGVQGVGYRWSTMERAEGLGLSGWVRNRSDGAVEAELEGPGADVEQLLAWMSEGPPSARVTGLQVTELAPAGGSGFMIRH